MVANHFKKYDDDFKKSLVSLFQNGKSQTQLCKEYGVSHSPLVSGSSSILPFRSMMAKSLLPNRLRNYKNAMPSSKRRTLS